MSFIKKIILVLVFFLLGKNYVRSQDTLILADGSEVYVKVLEIDEEKISYKKSDNLNGPQYSMDISKVFMAIYKGGKRETFQTSNTASKEGIEKKADSIATAQVLIDGNFKVRLIEAKTIPDKKGKATIVSAVVEAFRNDQLFTSLSVYAYQRKDIALDYAKVNGGYFGNSSISVSVNSEKLKNVLFQKYENESGKGYGWALPPGFFSGGTSSCSVAFLEQKSGNKEVLGFGGITSTKLDLQNCSSVENKLLSVVLVWLETNFVKK
jgi:hypothetical protein